VSNEYQYPKRDYVYDAQVVKIVDGDTVYVKMDLGCDVKIEPMKLRMNGINAKGKTTKSGKAAIAFLNETIPVGSNIRVETLKDAKEKYGRYLGILHSPGLNQSVNAEMVSRGLVEPYYGVGSPGDAE
jgi:endonuclease YncB( thermonuclease family)